MKKSILITFFIIFSFSLFAQDNVFVLVDISTSIKQHELEDAQQLVKDLLSGNTINTNKFKVDNTLPNYTVKTGNKIMIMPFGDKTTIMNYIPLINTINSQADVNNYINLYFPVRPHDPWTYISLAKARLAEIAKRNNINDYRLIIVSDNTSDAYGGHPNYSLFEQQLVDGYNTSNNPVTENPGIRIKLLSNNAFSVFVQSVNVSSYKPPSISNAQSIDSISAPLKIELTSYKGGTTQKPIIVNKNSFPLTWFCKSAPTNAKYKISISPIDNSEEKSQILHAQNSPYNIPNIADGRWRITISSDNSSFNASSDSTTIEVKNGSSLWILWVLLVPVLGGGGYWYWKKTQNDKLKKLNALSNSGSFSTGSTINTNSDNSGYF